MDSHDMAIGIGVLVGEDVPFGVVVILGVSAGVGVVVASLAPRQAEALIASAIMSSTKSLATFFI